MKCWTTLALAASFSVLAGCETQREERVPEVMEQPPMEEVTPAPAPAPAMPADTMMMRPDTTMRDTTMMRDTMRMR